MRPSRLIQTILEASRQEDSIKYPLPRYSSKKLISKKKNSRIYHPPKHEKYRISDLSFEDHEDPFDLAGDKTEERAKKISEVPKKTYASQFDMELRTKLRPELEWEGQLHHPILATPKGVNQQLQPQTQFVPTQRPPSGGGAAPALGTYTGSRSRPRSATNRSRSRPTSAANNSADTSGLYAYTAHATQSNRVKSLASSRRASMALDGPAASTGALDKTLSSTVRRSSTGSVRTRRERQYATNAYEAFCRAADKVSWVASGMGGQGATGGNIIGVQCYYDSSCYFRPKHGRHPKPYKSGPGSLPLLFEFYSKLQVPAQQYGKTLGFSELQQVNSQLSFFELLTLLRDYCIVPQIVNKREVFALWQIIFQEKVKKKKKHKNKTHSVGTIGRKNGDLTYTEFLDVLTLIALIGFGKPGFQQEVEKAEAEKLGIMSYDSRPIADRPRIKVTARAKVEFLASLMPLESVDVVRRRLRTQGRETQGKLNARAKGELSTFNVEELRKTRQLERLSRLMADQGLSTSDLVQRHAAFLTSTLEDDSVEHEGVPENILPESTNSEVHFGSQDKNKIQRMKIKQGNILVEQGHIGPDGLTPFQQDCLKDFSKSLREVWEPYRYEESVQRWEEMAGPYFDLGAVLKGFSYNYKLKITNLSQTSVGIAVRARELGRAISITYKQQTVPHGLTKIVKVELTTDVVDIGETFSFLDVEVTPTRMPLKPVVYSIPLYFKALVLNYGPESPELHPPALHKPNKFEFPENCKSLKLNKYCSAPEFVEHALTFEKAQLNDKDEDIFETTNLQASNATFGWGNRGFELS